MRGSLTGLCRPCYTPAVTPLTPHLLTGVAPGALSTESGDQPAELTWLRTLADSGFPVTPLVVVPARAQEFFYQLNNLGERVTQVFEGIDLGDPDDEDIEDLAPLAQELVTGHYLLDEFVDAFYDACRPLVQERTARRPGREGVACSGDRESLLAVKQLWAADWEFEAVWQRLMRGDRVLPPPRPVLLHQREAGPLDGDGSRDASALLGVDVEILGTADKHITRVRPVGG